MLEPAVVAAARLEGVRGDAVPDLDIHSHLSSLGVDVQQIDEIRKEISL